MSDIVNPPPSMLWVFNDEHPDSINDGWEVNSTNPDAGWTDLPSSLHGGTCGFSFADGHSEIKKWQDKSTIVRVTKNQFNGFAVSGSRDRRWVMERSTAFSGGR